MAGLWWLLKGTAERSHERALGEENRPKNAVLGTNRPGRSKSSAPCHSKNKLKSIRTYSSLLYKSKSYTERCPRPGLEV